MKFNKYVDYLCILFGAGIALYANAEKSQSSYLLIAGISLLMIGLYRVSSRISSKSNREDNNESEDI